MAKKEKQRVSSYTSNNELGTETFKTRIFGKHFTINLLNQYPFYLSVKQIVSVLA